MEYVIKNFNEVKDTKAFESLEQVPSLLMEITKAIASKNSS